ncbi:MAG: hypothetical protein ABI353_06695 [Isosphaeraceae bacterium]
MRMRSGCLIVSGLLTLVTLSPGQEPTESPATVKVLTKQAERQANLLRQTMADLRTAQAHVLDQKDDTEVATVLAERDRVEKQLIAIRRIVRSPRDPALAHMQKRSEQLANQYETLRAEKELSIRAQLQKDVKNRDRLSRALDRLTTEMERWKYERRTSEPQP